MNFAVAAMSVVFALAGPLGAKAPAAHASLHSAPSRGAGGTHVPVAPAPPVPPVPLAILPRLARIRVEATRERVVLIEEMNLPRGDWQGGGFDVHVAFGAPGTPIALDAALVTLADGEVESRLEDAGEAVPLEPAVRAGSAQVFLGKPQMAGVVVHVKDAALRRALAASGTAALRIRSLLRAPAVDADGARALVVRLGVAGGLPMTLGHIQVVSLEHAPGMTRAEAMLCGPDAEARPLTTTLLPKPVGRAAQAPPTMAPEFAVRHATDDLCIRWWGT